ncbi:ATP-binding cassette domain-containing protein [Clostridium sp. D2Q-11]|uniref:ATP-binding cassette domain-containing protein n=1 Tax=Anaeromonas frigoriresistens TaxID=2683708 RepID=A0A942UYS2_9FIRM|nr:ATP-binding cassette domain-containing protein [Anaeromonas frigoriresistens]MBS4539471.1 ATP-binding cassette domain-containing protein [Anaeromonas frigoriresistens]
MKGMIFIMISLKNISKIYKKEKALDNISFDIGENQIIGLVGENGAGKTAIMKIITGLIKEYEGEFQLKNNLRISKLIDCPGFYKNYDAMKNLRILGDYNNVLEEDINEIYNLFSLDDFGTKKLSQYSLGMKQRLAIAFAFLGNPYLIILDEPLNGLDPKKTIEIINIMKNIFMLLILLSQIISYTSTL